MSATYLLHGGEGTEVQDNVVWMSADGTWNRAVFATYISDSGALVPCPGGICRDQMRFCDYEHFQWCSRGHLSRTSAVASWQGRPLGPSRRVGDYPDGYAQHLDQLADRFVSG